MNTYRNLHYRVSNQVKKLYKDIVTPQLEWDINTPIWVKYNIYVSRKDSDTSNWWAVQDKFFLDALVDAWKIPDDSVDFVQDVRFIYKGQDKNNPRVEIEVYEITPEKSE